MLCHVQKQIKKRKTGKGIKITAGIATVVLVASFLPWVVFCVMLAILVVSMMIFVEFQAD